MRAPSSYGRYAFLFGYLCAYGRQLYRCKTVTGTVRGHFRDPWNNFDIIVYGLMITSVMLRVMCLLYHFIPKQ